MHQSPDKMENKYWLYYLSCSLLILLYFHNSQKNKISIHKRLSHHVKTTLKNSASEGILTPKGSGLESKWYVKNWVINDESIENM